MNKFEKVYQEMKGIETIGINHTFADEINHPSHYTTGKIEVIDYIIDKLTGDQFEGYVIGNVFKYCSRYQHKGGYQDLKKARWYLDKLLEKKNI
ncbi:MAG: DUF3310 domain-containing protein [Bacillota bacterium]|nr:DUF3310 domain-containing protein [Bacillota bacterium]